MKINILLFLEWGVIMSRLKRIKLCVLSLKQLFTLVCILAPFATISAPSQQCHTNEVTAKIVKQRDLFNKAIENADVDAIAALLSESVILVTGSDSVLFTGKQAQLDIWQSDFDKGDERDIYLRTTQCVTLSSLGTMAMEYGQWEGIRGDNLLYSGSYSAKWRFNGASQSWLLEAEIFMTDYAK